MRRGRWAVVRCARLRSALAVRPVGQGARRLHGWASGVRWLVGMIFDDGSTDRLLGRDVFLQMSALMIEAFFWQGLLLASGGGGEGAFLRDGARLTSRNALLARPIAWLALSWSTRFWVFVLRKGPRLSNVSRETFVSISHYIAILVSRETPQGGRGCSQRPRCLSRLPWHSSAASLRLPFAAPLLFRLPFPVAPHPSFRLSFPVHLRFPPPVPTPRPPPPPPSTPAPLRSLPRPLALGSRSTLHLNAA